MSARLPGIPDVDETFFTQGWLEKAAAVEDEGQEMEVRLGSPVVRPSKIICVGKNYADNLNLTAMVDGVVMQEGNTRDLIFSIPYLMAYISRDITLFPGDILSTGTPSGVGIFRDPPIVLQPGNLVECRIDRIGTIAKVVTAEA